MGLKLKVFIIFVFVSISLMWLAVYSKQHNLELKYADVQGVTDFSNYPIIQNIAPNTVSVGTEYRYELGVIDADTPFENIVINVIDKPVWLDVDNLVIWGIPSIKDLGTSRVEIEISDGSHSTYKTFYILVTPPDES